MVAWLTDPTIWGSFITLSVMEIVLGIDNVVFISVIVSRLPDVLRVQARRVGLALALVLCIVLLLGITWIIGLTATLLSVLGQDVSWRDVILITG